MEDKKSEDSSSESLYFDVLLNSNIDILKRTIVLNDDIDEEAFSLITKGLSIFEGKLVNPDDPTAEENNITIEICSGGGDLYLAFAIVDRIQACPCTVITRSFGLCMSAATLIASSGDVRESGTNTWWMFHDLSVYSFEDTDKKRVEVENDVRHHKELYKQMISLYTKFSREKTTRTRWINLLKKDSYISAKMVRQLGLVDELL